MKKILFVAMAATMFAACTQNEELENMGSNKEMKFNTAVMSTTKATVTTSSLFNKFKLYAYTGNDDANTIINGEIFNGSSSNVWTPETADAKFYWPGTDNVNFYGYSVATMGDAIFTKTGTSLSYTVKDNIAQQEDLLVAKEATTKTADGSVALSFTHALTKMSFKVKGEGANTLSYNVSSITVEALPTGNYNYADGTWAASGTAKTYSISNATTLSGGETEAISETNGDATLMLIPQSGAKIKVAYTLTNGGITIPTTDKEFTIPAAWTAGQNISYLITLDGAEEMKISGSLATSWDSAPASDTGL